MNKSFSFIFPVLLLLVSKSGAQDSLYTRQVIKTLCSEKMYGRGYVRNGLSKAAAYIQSEIRKTKAQALFENGFYQEFRHSVNTFPSHLSVSINGEQLIPGVDFIPSAENGSLQGKYSLVQKDSSTYSAQIKGAELLFRLKDKLTYTVGRQVKKNVVFELDKARIKSTPLTTEIKIKNRFIENFWSQNVGCFFAGTSKSDSMLVYTAHYDHLGGIGKRTYFAGANDNASGVSVLLNLIRYYDQHPPKYKTIFVFFAAEEAGLLGSEFFTSSSAIELKKIKFLINLDLLGTGDEGIMVVNGAIHTKEFSLLENINAENNLVPQIKKRGKAANSDHYWFSEKGVPCFFIYTMGGIKAYHDVYDVEKTLPLTKYKEVFQLLLLFSDKI